MQTPDVRRTRWWATLSLAVFLPLSSAEALSPLNLNPGYPTNLDDAYPVPMGEVVIQSGARASTTENSSRGQIQVPIDLRYGVSKHIEIDLGGYAMRGPGIPFGIEDPRAIRASLLARLFSQNGIEGHLPTMAVRTTLGAPIYGSPNDPTIKLTGLFSWKHPEHFYTHLNISYESAPGIQSGRFVSGRTGQLSAVGGLVLPASDLIGIVLDVRLFQDPAQVKTVYLVAPEFGLIGKVNDHFHLQLGVSRDFLGTAQQATLRGFAGLSIIF